MHIVLDIYEDMETILEDRYEKHCQRRGILTGACVSTRTYSMLNLIVRITILEDLAKLLEIDICFLLTHDRLIFPFQYKHASPCAKIR